MPLVPQAIDLRSARASNIVVPRERPRPRPGRSSRTSGSAWPQIVR